MTAEDCYITDHAERVKKLPTIRAQRERIVTAARAAAQQAQREQVDNDGSGEV